MDVRNSLESLSVENIRVYVRPLLFTLSLLVSIASGYTSFAGALEFLPVVPLTILLVVCVQSALLFSSWWVFARPDSSMKKEPRWAAVFIVTFGLSVGSSFLLFHASISSDAYEADLRSAQLQSGFTAIAAEVKDAQQDAYDDAYRALLAADYSTWQSGVRQFGQYASQHESAIIDEFQERDRQRALAQDERAAAFDRLQTSAADAEDDIARNNAEIDALQERRNQLREQMTAKRLEIGDLETEITDLEGLQVIEENRGLGGAGAGRGQQYNERQEQIDNLTTDLQVMRNENNTLLASDERIKGQIDELRLQNRELERTRETATKTGEVQEPIGFEADNQTSTQIPSPAKMLSALGDFDTTRDYEQLDFAIKACEDISVFINNANYDTQGLGCNSNMVAVQLADLRNIGRAQKAFDACFEGLVMDVAALRQYGEGAEQCLNRTGLPAAELSGWRTGLTRLNLETGDTAHGFVWSTNALLDFDLLAWGALFIAFVTDIFIAVFAMASQTLGVQPHLSGVRGADAVLEFWQSNHDMELRLSPNDSEQMRSAKEVLLGIEPQFQGDYRGRYPAELIDNPKQILLAPLITQGHVVVAEAYYWFKQSAIDLLLTATKASLVDPSAARSSAGRVGQYEVIDWEPAQIEDKQPDYGGDRRDAAASADRSGLYDTQTYAEQSDTGEDEAVVVEEPALYTEPPKPPARSAQEPEEDPLERNLARLLKGPK